MNELVSSGGSHERISESDGISPTLTDQMTYAVIYKSKSPPDMLNRTQNGLLQLQGRKHKEYMAHCS